MNIHERLLLASAFSTQPLELLPRSAQVQLSNISAMQLLENGDRTARETWQRAQLGNVLNHAAQKSPWWRERILSAPEGFASLPPLTRSDLAQQSEKEGSLVPPESGGKRTYASTGSTGTPVRVYTTAANGYYNVQRSLAQYFINDLPLSDNRVQINPALNLDAMQGPVVVRRGDNWAGDLSSVFANGSNREIIHSFAPGAMDEVVAAMLALQRRHVDHDVARKALDDASARLALVGRISRALYDPSGKGQDIRGFLTALSADVLEASGRTDIDVAVTAPHGLAIEPSVTVPLALIVAESVSNAIEHGLPDRPGKVAVMLEEVEGALALRIVDDGHGVAPDFQHDSSE